MNAQFRHASAYRLAIPKIVRFNLSQPCSDPDFSYAVSQIAKPVCVRLSPRSILVTNDLDHAPSVA
jgi:hypothetical protein